MMERVKKITGHRLFLPLSRLLIALFINLVTTPTFFKTPITNGVFYGYIINAINRTGKLVVLTVGMALVVSASVGTDISVGIVMAVAASVCTRVLAGGKVSVNECANPYILAMLTGLTVAVLYGCSNSFLVTKLRVQPMIATLILFTTGRGISQLIINGQITYIRMDGYKLLGSNIPRIPIPTPIFVAILVVVLTYVLLKKTAMGAYVQTMGISERASRLVGLKSTKIIWMAYAFCGPYTGIAGLVAPSRVCSADTSNIGLDMELDAIAAVALGGNSLRGGKSPLPGSVVGAHTIQALTTTLYIMSVSSDQIPMYKAIVVIIIVAVQSEKLKRFKERLTAKHTSKTVEGGAA